MASRNGVVVRPDRNRRVAWYRIVRRTGARPCAAASASSTSASGCPRPSSASRAQAELGAPKRLSRSALSAASIAVGSHVRRSRRQPASADHAGLGGSRPAGTATASAGNDGSSSSRNQRSSGVSSS